MRAGGPSPEECASLVVEVVPRIMRFLRAEMRQQAGQGLSVPQFRTLVYLGRCPGATLSEVAEHLGVTLSSMSRLVDRLVERGLVSRQARPGDRRSVTLSLSGDGEAVLQAVRAGARAEVAKVLEPLGPEQRQVLVGAFSLLEQVFSGGPRVQDR